MTKHAAAEVHAENDSIRRTGAIPIANHKHVLETYRTVVADAIRSLGHTPRNARSFLALVQQLRDLALAAQASGVSDDPGTWRCEAPTAEGPDVVAGLPTAPSDQEPGASLPPLANPRAPGFFPRP